jgi:hypothetical protein
MSFPDEIPTLFIEKTQHQFQSAVQLDFSAHCYSILYKHNDTFIYGISLSVIFGILVL